MDDQIYISYRDKRLLTLPGGFVGSYTCSITPFNTIEGQEVHIQNVYHYSVLRDEFQPNPQDSIRICPHMLEPLGSCQGTVTGQFDGEQAVNYLRTMWYPRDGLLR